MKKLEEPRSYQILTGKNTEIRCNRKDLLKTNESLQIQPEEIYLDKDGENLVTTDRHQETSHDKAPEHITTTRSGRNIKRPARYDE